jgi:catechol 2,3-dioxygenase-like lactoylglutathione lyase family enzyme
MEATMSTQTRTENATPAPSAGTVETKLEVIVIPLSDVDRAKQFYGGLGWRVDADFTNGPDWRVVQMTPPGSQTSVHFGKGITTAARGELIAKGADVSEPFHFTSIGRKRLPGVDPERRTYNTYAAFSDPDGNTWLLQEITTRFPGRGFSALDVATLTGLLREAEERHGYAAYIVAREQGRTPEDAVKNAGLHMEGPRR